MENNMNFVTLHDENGLEIDVNMDLVCTMQRDVFNLYTKIRFGAGTDKGLVEVIIPFK
jgi:hypothetical protein